MIAIEIKTTSKTKKMLDRFPKDTRKALINSMYKASAFLEGKVKKSFGRPGYPGIVTGHLRRSIYNRVLQRASNVIGIVGTEVIYGKFLEDGTKRMKARPFLRPAVSKNLTKLSSIITNNIAKELNK